MSDYIDNKQGQPHKIIVKEGFVFRLRKIYEDTKYVYWSCREWA